MGDGVKGFQQERERKSARLRLLFVLFLAVSGIGVMIGGSLIDTGPEPPPIKFQVFSLREVYAESLKRAQQWRSDAFLFRASVDVWLENDVTGRFISLGFRSPSSPTEYLLMSVKDRSGTIEYSLSPGKFSGEPDPMPDDIAPGDLALDAPEALEVGLTNGGRSFIVENGERMFWPAGLFLHQQDQFNMAGPFVWRLSYYVPSDGPGLTVIINAETGELLESEFREGPAAEE